MTKVKVLKRIKATVPIKFLCLSEKLFDSNYQNINYLNFEVVVKDSIYKIVSIDRSTGDIYLELRKT